MQALKYLDETCYEGMSFGGFHNIFEGNGKSSKIKTNLNWNTFFYSYEFFYLILKSKYAAELKSASEPSMSECFICDSFSGSIMI